MSFPIIEPPLLNSSSRWATTLEELQDLFDCEHTGAVTTRTSLLNGFEHDDDIHQHTFFSPGDHAIRPEDATDGDTFADYGASLNTLGYSPKRLSTYLAMITVVVENSTLPQERKDSKPFIISVTGSAEAVKTCYEKIQNAQTTIDNPLCMEINLSCPNIPDKPPPAYSGDSLAEYLGLLNRGKSTQLDRRVAIGIKTPPYTYHDQFKTLIDALLLASRPECPVDFITATNTLGSSLVLTDPDLSPALRSVSGAGIGGMAGAPLHPLALGNVKTIRGMLDEHEQLQQIAIIGVGGVSDHAGFLRMDSVGATAVGLATALGREGTKVFADIAAGGVTKDPRDPHDVENLIGELEALD